MVNSSAKNHDPVTPQADVPKRTRTISLSLRRKPKQSSFADLPPSPMPANPIRNSPPRLPMALPPLTLSPTRFAKELLPAAPVSSSPRQRASRALSGVFDRSPSLHPRQPSSPTTPTGPLPPSLASPIQHQDQGMLVPPQPAFLNKRRGSSNSSTAGSGYSSHSGSGRSYTSSAPSSPYEESCEGHLLGSPAAEVQERSPVSAVNEASPLIRGADSAFKGFGRRLFGRSTGVSARSPSSSSSSASGTTQSSPPLTPTTPPRGPYAFGGSKATLEGSISQLPPLGAAAVASYPSSVSSLNGSAVSPSNRSSHTSLRETTQAGEHLATGSLVASTSHSPLLINRFDAPQSAQSESAVDDSDFLRAVLNYDTPAEDLEDLARSERTQTSHYTQRASYQLSDFGPTRGFPSSATFGLSGGKRLPLAEARELERREHMVHSTRPKLREGLFRRDNESDSEDDYGSDDGREADQDLARPKPTMQVPSSFRRRIDGRKRTPLGAPRLNRPDSPISDMSHSTESSEQSFHSATGVGENLPRQPGLDSAPKRALYTCTLVKVHPHLGTILPLPLPTVPGPDPQYPRSINASRMLATHGSTTAYTRSLPIAVARTAVMRKLRREQLDLETEVEISWFQRKYGGDGFTAQEVMAGIAQRPSSSPEALAKPPGAGMEANEASRVPNGIRTWATRKSFASTHVVRLAGSSAALPVRRLDAKPEALDLSDRICALAGIAQPPKLKAVGVRTFSHRPVPKPVRVKVPAPWLADPKTRSARMSMLPPPPPPKEASSPIELSSEEFQDFEEDDSSDEEVAPEEEIPLAVIVAQRRERERVAAVAAEAQAVRDKQMREERAEAARRQAREAERVAERNRRKLVEARERRAKTEHSTVLQSHSYGAGNAAGPPVRKQELPRSSSHQSLQTPSRQVSRSTSQPTLQPSPSSSKTLQASTSQHQLRQSSRRETMQGPPSPASPAAGARRAHRTSTLPTPTSKASLQPPGGAPFLSPPAAAVSPRAAPRSPRSPVSPLLAPPSPMAIETPGGSGQFGGLLGQQLRQQQLLAQQENAQAMWALQQQQQQQQQVQQQQMLMMEHQRRSMMMGGMHGAPYGYAPPAHYHPQQQAQGFRPLVALDPGSVPASATQRF